MLAIETRENQEITRVRNLIAGFACAATDETETMGVRRHAELNLKHLTHVLKWVESGYHPAYGNARYRGECEMCG